MNIAKLPYYCKELINMYTLNKLSDYDALKEFNKICDYEPCEYSNEEVRFSNNMYSYQMYKLNEQQKRRMNYSVNEYINLLIYEYTELMTMLFYEYDILNKKNITKPLYIQTKLFEKPCYNKDIVKPNRYCDIIREWYSKHKDRQNYRNQLRLIRYYGKIDNQKTTQEIIHSYYR